MLGGKKKLPKPVVLAPWMHGKGRPAKVVPVKWSVIIGEQNSATIRGKRKLRKDKRREAKGKGGSPNKTGQDSRGSNALLRLCENTKERWNSSLIRRKE